MDDSLVSLLEFKKKIDDINDFNDGLYSAELAADGSGIWWTEPLQVGVMHKKDYAKMIQELMDGGPDKVRARSLKKYQTYSVAYSSKENSHKIVVKKLYKFADDITCNNNYFNPCVSGKKKADTALDLDMVIVQNQFQLVLKAPDGKRKKSKKKYVQFIPIAFCRMALNGDTLALKEDEEVSNMASAFGHLDVSGTVIDNDDSDEFEEDDDDIRTNMVHD